MSHLRADLIANFTYLATLVAPVAALVSVRLAKKRRYVQHRNLQLALLCFCWLAVLALETKIRLAGGSGALIRSAPTEYQALARRALLVHIGGAVLTYGLWTGLLVVSWRRFRTTLPGAFSRRHRQLGWLIVGGLGFTMASATLMYLMAFVL